jgi:hypothetical protein
MLFSRADGEVWLAPTRLAQALGAGGSGAAKGDVMDGFIVVETNYRVRPGPDKERVWLKHLRLGPQKLSNFRVSIAKGRASESGGSGVDALDPDCGVTYVLEVLNTIQAAVCTLLDHLKRPLMWFTGVRVYACTHSALQTATLWLFALC